MRRLFAAVADGPPARGSLLFAALFLALALPRLTRPPVYVFDEVYQAFTAGRYAAGDRDAYVWNTKAYGPSKYCAYEWIHPPVAKLVLATSILVLGDGPLGWRLPCVLAGAAFIALAYRVARRMLPQRGTAELAALALVLDGMVLVMSRTAMSDIFVALFLLGAYAAFWRWPEDGSPPDGGGARRALYATGALLGFGIATKWFGLLAWGFMGLVVGGEAVAALVAGLRRGAGARAAAGVLHVGLAMLAIPAAIYVASYLLFFAQGYSFGDFLELLRQEIYYHGHLSAKHDYASAWWTWPLLLRSVWLWTGTVAGTHRDIYILGNPVLWWTGAAALGALLVRTAAAWRRGVRRPHTASVLLLGFFGQWLPWAIPSRPAFIYYLLTAMPFLAMAAAGGVMALAVRGGPRGRFVIAAWVVALVAAAVWLYPLWTGLPLGEGAYRARLLLPGWK